jgi:hypothetical protein
VRQTDIGPRSASSALGGWGSCRGGVALKVLRSSTNGVSWKSCPLCRNAGILYQRLTVNVAHKLWDTISGSGMRGMTKGCAPNDSRYDVSGY